MRAVIDETTHGLLDYATVIAFALAPSLFDLSGTSAVLCYLLSVVHLAMTVTTRMRLGLWKVVSLRLHGFVELAVGIALLAAGLVPNAVLAPHGWFFAVAGAAILLVWWLSDYRRVETAAP
ncbi:MAG: hypothetical protein AAF919_06215 [Pseudomonadota bacterium]